MWVRRVLFYWGQVEVGRAYVCASDGECTPRRVRKYLAMASYLLANVSVVLLDEGEYEEVEVCNDAASASKIYRVCVYDRYRMSVQGSAYCYLRANFKGNIDRVWEHPRLLPFTSDTCLRKHCLLRVPHDEHGLTDYIEGPDYRLVITRVPFLDLDRDPTSYLFRHSDTTLFMNNSLLLLHIRDMLCDCTGANVPQIDDYPHLEPRLAKQLRKMPRILCCNYEKQCNRLQFCSHNDC